MVRSLNGKTGDCLAVLLEARDNNVVLSPEVEKSMTPEPSAVDISAVKDI